MVLAKSFGCISYCHCCEAAAYSSSCLLLLLLLLLICLLLLTVLLLLLLLLLMLLHLQLLLPLPVLLQLLLQLPLLVVLHCQHAPCCQRTSMLLLLLLVLLLLWHDSAHKHLACRSFPSLAAEQPAAAPCLQGEPWCAAVAAAGAAWQCRSCFDACLDALEDKLG
jgi:hypothetical protein